MMAKLWTSDRLQLGLRVRANKIINSQAKNEFKYLKVSKQVDDYQDAISNCLCLMIFYLLMYVMAFVISKFCD